MTAGLAEAVDGLYREVVMEPERWNESAFADWLETIGLNALAIDRDEAKLLRRAIRNAIKLQTFWLAADADRKGAERLWRARVDIAVGVPAWRPPLELAMKELYANPTPEGFDDVSMRFRVVNGTGWLEGTSFEAWHAEQIGKSDAR